MFLTQHMIETKDKEIGKLQEEITKLMEKFQETLLPDSAPNVGLPVFRYVGTTQRGYFGGKHIILVECLYLITCQEPLIGKTSMCSY